MDIHNQEVKKLVSLIKDSFRVRKNVRPIYVDVGDNLARLGAAQHQVIFGRRGSGKSCLLVEYLAGAQSYTVTPIYILADEFKRLAYPDILIRLLVEILEAMSRSRPWYRKLLRPLSLARKSAKELRDLLDVAVEADVSEGRELRISGEVSAGMTSEELASVRVAGTTQKANTKTAKFRERKIDTLERHLRDYKDAIVATAKEWRSNRGCVLVDDFYLIPRESQPDVVDYLHRLLRDTDVYLKVATIRHRTTLLRNRPQTIGVELAQDVEEINLDRTLEDLGQTEEFLGTMLDSMGRRAGIGDVRDIFNREALQALTLASGGVPRDFLTVFVNAVELVQAEGKARRITPRDVYKGAGRLAYQTKLRNLREDADGDAGGLERVLVDLVRFCLKDKRKTGFLISQEEAQSNSRGHEIIQQLMDFKLIHVVEPDTSAASGRSGRYEAYTLDFSLFMEPRRRNIEIVEFWKRGDDSHRVGVRELPVYPLEQAARAFDNAMLDADAEAFLGQEELEADTAEAGVAGTPKAVPTQGSLFDGDPTRRG